MGLKQKNKIYAVEIIEQCHDKNCLRGFQPGPTQTRLLKKQIARGLKLRISKEEGVNYLCSENKAADQLRAYRRAQLLHAFVFAFSRRGSIVSNRNRKWAAVFAE